MTESRPFPRRLPRTRLHERVAEQITAWVADNGQAHADRLPEVIETRDALETEIAALAAVRRTDDDLARIEDALRTMESDLEAGGRGVEGDERFHGAAAAADRR